MNFFELKEKAKADGMEITSKTTKSDIDLFYSEKKEPELEEVKAEAVKEVIVEKIVEVPAKCNHIWEFTNIQAVRGPSPRDEEGKLMKDSYGNIIKGKVYYKDRYKCRLCGEVEIRDSLV